MAALSSRQQRAMLEVFEAALDLPEEERRAHIEAHAPDEGVRDGALSLLARHVDSELALRTGMPGALGAMDFAYDPPERLGPYRIVRAIGRGGMGVVYLGERDSGDFERTVAIKIIRPGLLSRNLVERFTRERQIMAGLDHPHIARMYDGGQTDDGAPYLVMEYVEGRSLSSWLSEADPALAQRLDLLLQVCDAVEFAHRNLIVHRDLTPSNVLVTDQGEAKLIDFGIARPQASDGVPMAQSPLSGLSLTPGFAAPERQTGAPVTTLTDIYSLGQIMAILIKPFAKPELQAIADKAAAEDPEDRYAGAALMARDIRAYREGRAVRAYSTDGTYWLRKYVGRNRLPVALAGLVAVLLVGGLIGLTDAYRDAARERDNAEQRFSEVRALANFLLFDLYDELEDVPGTTQALNDIADRARQYLDVLSATDGASDEVRLEAALAYKRLSDVLGTPIGANLGRREEAGETLGLAIDQLRVLHQRAPGNEAVTRGLAEALYSQAVFAFIALDDNELAHATGQESADLYWQLAERFGRETYAPKAIDAEIEAAIPLGWIDRGAQGVTMLKGTLGKMEQHIEHYGETPANIGLLARTLSNLSETAGRLADAEEGDYAEALDFADRAIATYRTSVRLSERPDAARRSMAIALFKRALILYSMERDTRALTDLDEAEAIIAGLSVRDPLDQGLVRTLVSIQEQKAITLAYAGQGRRAIELVRKSTADKRTLVRGDPDNPGLMRDLAANLVIVGELAEISGFGAESCAAYREGDALFERIERLNGLSSYDREVVMVDMAAAIERTC